MWGSTPDTVLVAVDTFAVVRALGGDQTYGSDYQEVRQLKALADELKITLLMVHHVRKLGDSDPLNRLSGTTGIVGAADTVLILETQPPQRELRHLLRHWPGHGVPGDGAALPPGDLLLGAALRYLGAAGKAIAPGDAVPGGLYEKAKTYKGGQRRTSPRLSTSTPGRSSPPRC